MYGTVPSQQQRRGSSGARVLLFNRAPLLNRAPMHEEPMVPPDQHTALRGRGLVSDFAF